MENGISLYKNNIRKMNKHWMLTNSMLLTNWNIYFFSKSDPLQHLLNNEICGFLYNFILRMESVAFSTTLYNAISGYLVVHNGISGFLYNFILHNRTSGYKWLSLQLCPLQWNNFVLHKRINIIGVLYNRITGFLYSQVILYIMHNDKWPFNVPCFSLNEVIMSS